MNDKYFRLIADNGKMKHNQVEPKNRVKDVIGGDAAEQVVRISLEGVEVAVKIIGEGAKNLAIMIAAILKEEQKAKGNEREKVCSVSDKHLYETICLNR